MSVAFDNRLFDESTTLLLGLRLQIKSRQDDLWTCSHNRIARTNVQMFGQQRSSPDVVEEDAVSAVTSAGSRLARTVAVLFIVLIFLVFVTGITAIVVYLVVRSKTVYLFICCSFDLRVTRVTYSST